MATTLTRFECFIPVADTGTSQDTAIQTFFNNMQTLTPCVQQVVYVGTTYSYWLVGFLTATQSSTALTYLEQLNTSLGTLIACNSWSVTSQP